MAHRITKTRKDLLAALPTPWALEAAVMVSSAATPPFPLAFLQADRILTVNSRGQVRVWPRSSCTQFQITHRAEAPETVYEDADLATCAPGRRLNQVHLVTGAVLSPAYVLEDARVAGLDGIGRVQVAELRDVDWFTAVGATVSLQRCRREGSRWVIQDTLGRRRLTLPRT